MDARKRAIKAHKKRYEDALDLYFYWLDYARQIRREYQAVRKLAGLKPLPQGK
jgi:hypothetical protein